MNPDIDVRPVLPSVRVPTLVLHRPRRLSVERPATWRTHPRGAAGDLSGDDHLPWIGDATRRSTRSSSSSPGRASSAQHDRVLATVSVHRHRRLHRARGPARRPSMEDRSGASPIVRPRARPLWRAPSRHCRRRLLRDVRWAGPCDPLRPRDPTRYDLGIRHPRGIHTGEVELLGDDILGIAVHIGARIARLAVAGEVLVSSTVRDLVVGSGDRDSRTAGRRRSREFPIPGSSTPRAPESAGLMGSLIVPGDVLADVPAAEVGVERDRPVVGGHGVGDVGGVEVAASRAAAEQLDRRR